MTRGSISWLVRALRDWTVGVRQGMALVTYLSSSTRELVSKDLSLQLRANRLTTETLSCQHLSAEGFVNAIAKSEADVLIVLDPDRLLFGENEERAPFWINFHRETIVLHRGVQIWWMPPDSATRFGQQLPDLNRFFLFREELKTARQIERDTSLKFQISYSPDPVIGDRGPDYLKRALKASAAEPNAGRARIWLELGIPAIEAFVSSAQTIDGMRALEELTRAVGPPEQALDSLGNATLVREVARAFLTLGTLYRLAASEFGNRTEHLRHALSDYQRALTLLPENTCPEDRAAIQYGLGTTYWYLGSREQPNINLKRAVEYYRAALQIYTEKDFPWDWARTQNSLGATYGILSAGDRNENLGRAISCYEAALRVRTKQSFPKDWAQTEVNLGLAYSELPTGDLAENLRDAIGYYEAALTVYTEHDFPEDWAGAQISLGVAYSQLPTGDLAENLLRAIDYYKAALRVYTEKDFPKDWAQAQVNLGLAYYSLLAGDRAETLLGAIDCYQAALRVYTVHDFPSDWAQTQVNLGFAYRDLPAGDRAENLRRAIGCYEAASTILTEHEFPVDWALIQTRLALSYMDLPDDRMENLRRAIAFCENALRVYNEQEFPRQWAALHKYLKTFDSVREQ